MGKEINMVNEIDGVVKNYRGCFKDFAQSLKLIGDISMESGCASNEHTYRLVAAMLEERETTIIALFDEFAHDLNFTAKEALKNVLGEDILKKPEESSSRLRDEGSLAHFIQECCTLDKDCVDQEETALYDAFERWYLENVSKQVPDKKSFVSILSKRFERVKGISGRYFYDETSNPIPSFELKIDNEQLPMFIKNWIGLMDSVQKKTMKVIFSP